MQGLKKSLIVISLLTSTGCYPSGPLDYRLDPSFTSQEKAWLIEAAAEWEYATQDSDATVRVCDPESQLCASDLPIIFRIHSWEMSYAALKTLAPEGVNSFRGMLVDGTGDIAIIVDFLDEGTMNAHRDQYRIELQETFLHELGHAFGIGHEPGNGLMRRKAGDAHNACIDQIAMEAYCDLHDCGADAASTCG